MVVESLRDTRPLPSFMLDFDQPADLRAQLEHAFAPTPALRQAIADYADAIHPARDGRASERVIAATEALLAGELGTLRRKPLASLYRGLQIRRELGYWGRAAR